MGMTFFAKLLLTGQLKFKDGTIELKNIYLTMLPSFFIYEIMRDYIERKKGHILYLISWIAGFITDYQVFEIFKPQSVEQKYSLGMNLGEAMGIGLYKTHEYYPGRYTHFIIHENPFTKWFKKMDEPVDYFIAGAMGGGGCFIHNSITQCIEAKCVAKGDPYCEFITATEEELKNRGLWESVKERYRLEKIFPIQKFVYENVGKIDEKELVNKVLEMVEELE